MLSKMKEHFDSGSLSVIFITFILFVMALFTKGFTHDLLLEAGVFLVSVKLILMAYQNSVTSKAILKDLRELKHMLEVVHQDCSITIVDELKCDEKVNF